MNPQTPPPAVSDHWQDLLEDATATAEEYDNRGWKSLLIHTGDVTPLLDTPFGLDVLAPGDEFETLESLVETVSFDTTHVYRTEAGNARFFIIVVEATDDTTAVIIPAFLALTHSDPLEERATDHGAMYTYVRPLSDDARVTFTHDDPSLFF